MSTALGAAAEQRAKAYLVNQGLTFVTQNYRRKCGEIDLIFTHKSTWIFVEVKYRTESNFGHPTEQMTRQKVRRVTNAVRAFLLDNHLNEFHTSIRIDLVAMTQNEIEWIKNVTG